MLVPRDGGKPRTIETDPFFHFHVNNAYEDGGDTVVDLVRYDDYSIGENSLTEFRTGGFDEPSALWRLRVKPSGELGVSPAVPVEGRVPAARLAPDTMGHRCAYMAGGESKIVASGIVKVDHEAETGQRTSSATGHVLGEPIFVPRSPDSAEDDGWLLARRLLRGEHRSRLVVLDARDVESDPVAVAHLRHHVPLGFTARGPGRRPNGASLQRLARRPTMWMPPPSGAASIVYIWDHQPTPPRGERGARRRA